MSSHKCPTAPGKGPWCGASLERGPRLERPPRPRPERRDQSVEALRADRGSVIGVEVGVRKARLEEGMDRFVSTFTNKVDAKGRVSVPAPFRTILERDGYAGGIYCYPSLDAPALDAGGKSLAENIDRLLDGLPDYSDERDELSVALYCDVFTLTIDQDGRIVLPEALRAHAGISTHVAF